MGKILVGLIALVLLIAGFAGEMSTGVTGLRTDPTTEAFVVVTGAGVTSANVTLVNDPFQDDLVNITSITSNASETPIATTYTTATNALLVTDLTAATTRTLTVNFDFETVDPVWSAIGPFLLLLLIGSIAALIFVGMLKKGGRRGRA